MPDRLDGPGTAEQSLQQVPRQTHAEEYVPAADPELDLVFELVENDASRVLVAESSRLVAVIRG